MVGIVQGKKRLFILGAGGFGRELESWLDEIPDNLRDWYIEGFLDDNLKALDGYPSSFNIIGRIDGFEFQKNDLVVMGIANPKVKETIYNSVVNKVEFFTFISPKATVGRFSVLEEGTVVCPGVVITTNTVLEKLTIVNCGSQIGHDAVIGRFSSLMSNVDIGGGCKIGEKVYMGTKSTLIHRKIICSGSLIGAGAVVFRNVIKKGTYIGNPAARL